MKPTDFDFHLPGQSYVRVPLKERDGGRLMVLRRASGEIEHRMVVDLPDLLAGETVYGNDAKLEKIRFEIELPGGFRTEALILEHKADGILETMARLPMEYSVSGTKLSIVNGPPFTVLGRVGSTTTIQLDGPLDMEAAGSYSLPPWCDRPQEPVDWARYEPVYARRPGSIARASAGACLTQEAIARMDFHYLTLYVHLGAFDALPEEGAEFHRPHPERYEIEDPPSRPVVVVGSTALRALAAFEASGITHGLADNFICPPWQSTLIKGFLTNFHFPMESVLVMTCAIGGKDLVMRAHVEAAKKGYRFGDWGDSLLIL